MSGRFPLVEVEAHAKVKWFPRVLREDAGQILALSRIRNLGQVELSTASSPSQVEQKPVSVPSAFCSRTRGN